jgi:hypothetical protein
LATVVADFDAGDGHTAFAERARLTAENFNQNGAGLTLFECRQRLDLAVAVAVGEAEEDVGDGAEAGFGRRGGELGTDSVEGLDRGSEDAGAGPVDGGVAELGAAELAGAGEGAHYWAASSHHQLG